MKVGKKEFFVENYLRESVKKKKICTHKKVFQRKPFTCNTNILDFPNLWLKHENFNRITIRLLGQ